MLTDFADFINIDASNKNLIKTLAKAIDNRLNSEKDSKVDSETLFRSILAFDGAMDKLNNRFDTLIPLSAI